MFLLASSHSGAENIATKVASTVKVKIILKNWTVSLKLNEFFSEKRNVLPFGLCLAFSIPATSAVTVKADEDCVQERTRGLESVLNLRMENFCDM